MRSPIGTQQIKVRLSVDNWIEHTSELNSDQEQKKSIWVQKRIDQNSIWETETELTGAKFSEQNIFKIQKKTQKLPAQ